MERSWPNTHERQQIEGLICQFRCWKATASPPCVCCCPWDGLTACVVPVQTSARSEREKQQGKYAVCWENLVCLTKHAMMLHLSQGWNKILPSSKSGWYIRCALYVCAFMQILGILTLIFSHRGTCLFALHEKNNGNKSSMAGLQHKSRRGIPDSAEWK